MKIIFAGTPAFAVESLRALHAAHGIAAVLTQPDKPQGRKRILTPSCVKEAAIGLGIPVLQPQKLREDFSALAALRANLMVTCAYGQILTQEVLDLFPLGVWNVHASLLPAYRGAAPIARAIIDGCEKTGVTIMKTEIGLDTGDVFLQEEIPIAPDDDCGTLSKKLSAVGARLIAEAVGRIGKGDISLRKQGEGFVCKKVQRTQADFSRSAAEVSALIRGLSPAPLCFGTANGLTLNFYGAEEVAYCGEEPFGTVLSDSPKRGLLIKCGTNAVKITVVQPAGGKAMSASDFLNGRKLQKGMRFDQPVL
ncbi:MAG: methionyl-tRNA formyltransferase [Candidatus Gallimonas sp.]